ncbi:uncharacterized protein IWZ02DRAFT_80281 [Phyllosticta citriasiana]|uniref:uncharacterized protein n=1 Tax=Phyllosticta citriasiana TaxID=595635 RepID=UPI0030FD52AE
MVKRPDNQHHKDYKKYTNQEYASDCPERFTAYDESTRKPRRKKSSVFEPLIEQSVAGETASTGRRRRIQIFGRRVMLMVKFYSCLGWPFKNQTSVWQLSQVDESMVPQSRPSSENSNRQDDGPQPAASCGTNTSSMNPSPIPPVGNNSHLPKDNRKRARPSRKTSLASELLEDPQCTQMNNRIIDCQKAPSEIEKKTLRSQTKQNLSASDESLRSSLPRGMSARRVGVPQPWIDTSILDGIDGTPLFNCDSKKSREEESFESIFLQAIRTPLPDMGPSAPDSPIEPPLVNFNQEASIDALFQQAIRTPLPEETPVAHSEIQLKPSPSSSKPPNYSLPRPTAPFSLPLNHSEKSSVSKAIAAAQNNSTIPDNKPLGLPSLLDPICLTPKPTIPSLQVDEASIATPLQEPRYSALPRIPKRYSLRLRSRLGSNKSTKSKPQESLNLFKHDAPGRFQLSRNSYRERRDSAISMQTPAKTVWSRCPTPLPPLDLPRGRYRPYVPDFPSFDPTKFALSPNFDDEVRVAAAERLPDGEDDDGDDDDDSVYDEDEDVGGAGGQAAVPVSASAPSLALLQRAAMKPLAARALSLRRRSRDGLSFAGLRRFRNGSLKGEGASTPAASASAPAGPSMLEEVCNRCRIKLASVWPGSGSVMAVAA